MPCNHNQMPEGFILGILAICAICIAVFIFSYLMS